MSDIIYSESIGQFEGFDLEFRALVEYEDPCDNDDHYDTEEKKQELYDQINSGRVEWFCACVVASKAGIELGSDYLGACLYNSYDEFLQDAYCQDMKAEAVREAKQTLAKLCCS